MKYIYFTVLLIIITNMLFAQTDYGDDYLYFKCGTQFGKTSELAEGCLDSIPKDLNDAYIKKYELCVCLMETIANNFTYKEFEKLVTMYGENWKQYVLLEGDPIVISDFEDCTFAYASENFDWTKNEERFVEVFMNVCILNVENDQNFKDFNIDVFEFCSCLKEEFLQRGFRFSELDELEDENSILFNEVLISCVNESEVSSKTPDFMKDVTGSVIYSSVSLINFGGASKVKINFGNISKYFVIDSGASHTFISLDFERELISAGLVQKENYLSDEYYTLADNSIVKCRRILLNNVTIGPFTVKNVIVAVADNSDTYLLLGKSFLDKFKKWSIDNEKSKLYLERK